MIMFTNMFLLEITGLPADPWDKTTIYVLAVTVAVTSSVVEKRNTRYLLKISTSTMTPPGDGSPIETLAMITRPARVACLP